MKIELTANKAGPNMFRKLLSFGFENNGFNIKKIGPKIEINAFGVTLGVYDSFEEIYLFAT